MWLSRPTATAATIGEGIHAELEDAAIVGRRLLFIFFRLHIKTIFEFHCIIWL